MNKKKIALKNLNGEVTAHFAVSKVGVEVTQDASQLLQRHHLIIVDRSSSMSSYLRELQSLLLKLLTLEEYRDDQSLITMISFGGREDDFIHCERMTLREVMLSSSEILDQLIHVQTSTETSLYKAFSYALTAIREEETSQISLHSDGHSLKQELNKEPERLFKLVQKLQGSSVKINTIAPAQRCDLSSLAELAEQGHGASIVASDLRQVYDAHFNTSQAMIKSVARHVRVPANNREGWILVAPQFSRTVCGEGPTELLDLDLDESAAVYLIEPLGYVGYEALAVPTLKSDHKEDLLSLLALSRYFIFRREFNLAKYALLATKNQPFILKHIKAISGPQLTSLSQDLEDLLLRQDLEPEGHRMLQKNDRTSPSVQEVMELLNRYRGEVLLDQKRLNHKYPLIGLKRVIGERDEQGQLHVPSLSYHALHSEEHGVLESCEINQNNATIHLRMSEAVILRDAEGEDISELSGIELSNLRQFRSYCVVSDGVLHLNSLWMVIQSKSLFRDLCQWGLLSGEYDPVTPVQLSLDQLPLARFSPPEVKVRGMFDKLAQARLLRSFLKAYLKGYSDRFTEEQLEALQAHYLTPKLHLNFPMTSAHSDLPHSIAQGEVGTKLTYHIDLGNHLFAGLDRLPSASAFFRANYRVVTSKGNVIPPELHRIHDGQVRARSGLKATPSRDLLKPLMDDLLMIEQTGMLRELFVRLGISAHLIRSTFSVIRTGYQRTEQNLRVLSQLLDAVEAGLDHIYQTQLTPLIYYLGTTGCFPDSMSVQVLYPEEARSRYQTLRLPESYRDGLIFDLGEGSILSVKPMIKHVTVRATPRSEKNQLNAQKEDQLQSSATATLSAGQIA